MKKKLLVPFGAALGAILVSCGGTGESSLPGSHPTGSDGPTSSSEIVDANENTPVFSVFNGKLEQNVKIQVLENDTAKELGYLDELLDAFNEKYAAYGIEAVDANIDQYSDLAQDGPYGYGPDVLYQANDVIMKYTEARHVFPIPSWEVEAFDNLPETAIEAYQGIDSGVRYTYGVPINAQAGMLFYRKDLLPANSDADGNGTPDVVESWNALWKFSKDINAADPTKRGYAKALYDVYFSSGYLFSYGAYVFGDNGQNPLDIGFNKGEAWKGARVIRQLAEVIGPTCVDDSINTTCYGQLARGEIFATMTTPDVTENFITEMTAQYETEGLSSVEADAKARENLVIAGLPKLPASGDLSEENPEFRDMQAMGGINGYAISAYTKVPNAALEFVKFATSYEMVKLREEMLGIAPCREDVVAESQSPISENIFSRLEDGLITLMPSINEVAQIWTPGESFNKDLATDPTRDPSEQKYKTQDDYQKGLDDMCDQILEAITTLA